MSEASDWSAITWSKINKVFINTQTYVKDKLKCLIVESNQLICISNSTEPIKSMRINQVESNLSIQMTLVSELYSIKSFELV